MPWAASSSPHDMPTVRGIVRNAAADDYRFLDRW